MDDLSDMELDGMMGGAPDGMESDDEEDVMMYEDLDVGEEKDVSKLQNGGIMKKVLVKGSGEDRPEKGSEVTVHYTGTLLDGTKFDSSVDRGQPFKFTLGLGQVIKGWDEGVASMKKGEKAILTCQSDYAYGSRGSPPNIPPDSTLQFEVELFSWKSDKDLFNDGGCVRVKTLKKGSGYRFPKEIDEVSVAYSVTAPDGGEIVPATDATFAVKSAPFEGLAKLLTKMKEGESSLVKMADAYCAGLPGAPAAADVKVTLKSLKIVDAICGGAGTKKTLTEGKGWDTPNDGAKCTVSFTTKLASSGAVVDEVTGFTFETGNEAVPRGFEEAAMKMKKGEVAEAVVPASHAYGAEGKTGLSQGDVPTDADVVFTITMTDFEKEKETYSMSTPEKIEAADKVKTAGNDAYKAGKLALASKKYDKALRYVEHDQSFGDEEKVQSKALKLSLYLNAAAVALKQKDWRNAQGKAGKALEIEGSNEKALYRRAQAAAEIEEYEEAKRDIKKLLAADGKHREGRVLLARIKKLEAAQAKKDAKVFGGMFSKLGGLYNEDKKLEGPGGEDFVPAKASGDEPKLEPIDIGNGFSMEEIQDGDGDGDGDGNGGEPAKP